MNADPTRLQDTAQGERTADYDFALPADRIAQAPLARRDASRLMVVDRGSATIAHKKFTDIVDLLKSLSPVQALLIFAGCSLAVHLFNRSRESLLIACTAALYALPMIIMGK